MFVQVSLIVVQAITPIEECGLVSQRKISPQNLVFFSYGEHVDLHALEKSRKNLNGLILDLAGLLPINPK